MAKSKLKQKESRIWIGERLRKARRQRNLSQEAVALAAEMSLSHYSCLERGIHSASVDSLGRIADAIDISIVELLVGADRPTVSRESSPEEALWNEMKAKADRLRPQIRRVVLEHLSATLDAFILVRRRGTGEARSPKR